MLLCCFTFYAYTCFYFNSFETKNAIFFIFKKRQSKDEEASKVASLLAAFKTIITVSCWCEPKVICLLFQATKKHDLDQGRVAKVCCFVQILFYLEYQSNRPTSSRRGAGGQIIPWVRG